MAASPKAGQPRGSKGALSDPEVGAVPLKEKIKEVFQRYDSSGDGSLSRSELRRALAALSPSLSEPEIERFMIELDSSGDGEVSYTEFVQWLKHGGSSAEVVKRAIAREGDERANRIKKVFTRYDASGDGCLDISEVRAVLKKLCTFTNNDVVNVCKDLDRNGDGEISLQEFAQWVRSPAATKEIMKAKAILAPSDDDGLEAVFYSFCGAGHADMDGTAFLKLLKDCHLLDAKLTEKDAELLFSGKLKAKGQRTIGFSAFELSIRLVAEKKGVSQDEVRTIFLESVRPVLQGTKATAEANRFHDGLALAAVVSLKAKAKKAKSTSTLKRLPAEEPRKVDNTDLWRTFGIDSQAGRTLKRLYSQPQNQFKGNGRPAPDMFVVVNSCSVPTPGLQYRRSRHITDVCTGAHEYVPWGECVQGDIVDICWLKVGDRFLPTEAGGVKLLKRCSGPGAGMRKSTSLPDISGGGRGSPVNRKTFETIVEGLRY